MPRVCCKVQYITPKTKVTLNYFVSVLTPTVNVTISSNHAQMTSSWLNTFVTSLYLQCLLLKLPISIITDISQLQTIQPYGSKIQGHHLSNNDTT